MRNIPSLLCVFVGSIWGNAAWAQQAETIWVSNEDRFHLLRYASFISDEWLVDASPFYESENAISTPTILDLGDDDKLIVWSEMQEQESVLMMSIGRLSFSGVESAPKLVIAEAEPFSDLGNYALAPSGVIDQNGIPWLFWTVDDGVSSDIYFARKSDGSWSNPELVHKKNSVPDNSPVARLTKDGHVEVVWTSYDLEADHSVELSQVYEISPKFDKHFDEAYEAEVYSKTPAPPFIPLGQRVIIHFPGLYLNQNQVYSAFN